MIYTIITIVSLIMVGASICACFKPGKSDNISKYEEDDEQ